MNQTDLLSICLQTPGCLPPLLWGDPGIGKTSQVEQLVRGFSWDIEVLRPAERGEGALGVVPVPSEDRKVLHYPMPDWAARLASREGPSLVFLDEVSSTPPALQPAIMGLALDGVIAGQRLPANVKRAAAANPIDQAAGGWELAPALANRFVHLEWRGPGIAEWTDWLSGQAVAVASDVLNPDAWQEQWPQARALGMAFMRRFPLGLKEDMTKTIGRTPPAFATPRSWETALRLLASCRAMGRMDLYPALAAGALGPSVALEGVGGNPEGAWLVWLKNNDLPDPEALLADPELFRHDPKRPDCTLATLFAVSEAALLQITGGKKLTDKIRGERWRAGWSVLARAHGMRLGKDVVLLAARQMADLKRRPKADPGKDGRAICEVLDGFISLYSE